MRGHQITLLTVCTNDEDRHGLDDLDEYCASIKQVNLPTWRSLVNCIKALPTREPLQMVYSWDPDLAEDLYQLATSSNGAGSYDVIHIEHLRGARYGVDLIIRAVDKVRQDIPGIHLSLLGSGETRDDLITLTQELDLPEHVKFSAQTLHVSELPQVIRRADVGIVPNRSDIFTDGLLPTKLMEYVALGTPVIAARTPTIESYFDDTMVKFFKPGDIDDLAACIISLHANRSLLVQFAQNSEKFNQKYGWPSVAANYVALVNRLNGRH